MPRKIHKRPPSPGRKTKMGAQAAHVWDQIYALRPCLKRYTKLRAGHKVIKVVEAAR